MAKTVDGRRLTSERSAAAQDLGRAAGERAPHGLGDQLHLRELSVRWQRGWHGAWGVAFELHRTSDEPGVSGRYHGKGAVTCGDEGQLLHAWAMGPAG
ncbi:MAG: hypothetical protein M3134_03865 [Actinomycetota bacterium]|nr:hypothetical protein [Actinomycetota bacterium]